jgi:acyl-CoA thioesterase FadM
MQGIVFNAHYLVWADEALTPWWLEQGIDWQRFGAEGTSTSSTWPPTSRSSAAPA